MLRALRNLDHKARLVSFQPGEVVIREGQRAEAFYLILRGRAGVAGRQLSHVLREGDHFGEIALIDGGPHSATVIAVDELRTVEIRRRAFLGLLERDPEFARTIMESLAQRLRKFERQHTPKPPGDGPVAWPIPGLS